MIHIIFKIKDIAVALWIRSVMHPTHSVHNFRHGFEGHYPGTILEDSAAYGRNDAPYGVNEQSRHTLTI